MAMMLGRATGGPSTQIDGSSLEKISLAFSAQNLPKANTFGTTDPFITVYVIKDGAKRLIGHTEVAMDNYHPLLGTALCGGLQLRSRPGVLSGSST